MRKVAMWDRLLGSLVQYCSGSLLQPPVIPDAASASMSASLTLPSVSTKPAGSAGSKSKARTRILAIWPRLTEVSGQVAAAALGYKPTVISSSASRST